MRLVLWVSRVLLHMLNWLEGCCLCFASAPQFRRLSRSPEVKPDHRRGSASESGYNYYWTSVVAPAIRERDGYLCQQCLKEGGLGQAMDEMMSRPIVKCQQCRGRSTKFCSLCEGTGVHRRQPPVGHIKPGHVCTPEEFYDPANLETLCESHNQKQRYEDERRYGSAKR